MQFVEAPVDLCWSSLDEREPEVVKGSLVNEKTRRQPGASLGVLEGLLVHPHLHVMTAQEGPRNSESQRIHRGHTKNSP